MMELSSASSVALTIRIVGHQLGQAWADSPDVPGTVEDLYDVCRRYFSAINNAIARYDDYLSVIAALLDELLEMKDSYGDDPNVGNELGMLVDAVTLSMTAELTVSHFQPTE